jgi:hypothetical protein
MTKSKKITQRNENKKALTKNEKDDPIVSIAATISSLTVGMIALIVLFANLYAWTIPLVVLIMAVFGISLAYISKKYK